MIFRGNHDNMDVAFIGGSFEFFLSNYSLNAEAGRTGHINSVTLQDAFPRPVARLLVTVAAAVSLFVLGLLCLQFSSHWWGIGRMSWLLLADILKQNKVNHPNMRFDPRARTANSDRFIADYENDHISYCWSALLNFRAKEEEIKEGSFTISSSMNAENSKSSGSLPSYGVCCRINLRMCILSNGISKELNLLIDYCSYILKHFIIKL